MGNPVVHFEIIGDDLDKASAFYGELFGWQIQSIPDMGYAMIDTQAGSGINGGLGVDEQGGGKYVVFYIEVDDTDAALASIEKAGGTTLIPTQVLPMVTFAQFQDPAGNRVGLVKADPAQEGGGPSSGTDNPEVGWFEALGKDADALAEFYTSQFGWTTKRSETPEFIYHEVYNDKGSSGGIGSSMDGLPRVNVYAGVDDVTKTLERAESLGATTVMPETKVAEDTIIGLFSDPQGNVFGVYKRMPR